MDLLQDHRVGNRGVGSEQEGFTHIQRQCRISLEGQRGGIDLGFARRRSRPYDTQVLVVRLHTDITGGEMNFVGADIPAYRQEHITKQTARRNIQAWQQFCQCFPSRF